MTLAQLWQESVKIQVVASYLHLDFSKLEFLSLVQSLEYSLVFDFVCSQSQFFGVMIRSRDLVLL